MKRFWQIRQKVAMTIVAGLLWVGPAAVQAQFIYTTNNGTIIITGYTGLGGDVVIPDTINGLPVTSIGNNAFAGCQILTSVTIPAGITSIGDYAFDLCTHLTNAPIGNSITNIGVGAFSSTALTAVSLPSGISSIAALTFTYCSSLASITMPDSLTKIGTSAFAYCGMTNVILGNNVTNLEDYTFQGCSSLVSVTIGNSVTRIGNYVFDNCWVLASITIPDNVAELGDFAFESCFGMTNVVIGSNLTSIGTYPFEGCNNLAAIVVAASNPDYSSLGGVWFDKTRNTLIEFPPGIGGSYTIPDGVTSIGNSAFSQCSSLTNVVISASVTNLGDDAFFDCSSLSGITIGNGVTTIGNRAFAVCTGLSSISIPDNVNRIGNFAFHDCTSLTAIKVAASNSSYSSFNGLLCDKSRTILTAFPPGIGGNYTIPDTITSIADYAFESCNLTGVTIPDSVSNIGGGAFENSGLTNVTVGKGITDIGALAFCDCYNLVNIFFEGSAPATRPNSFSEPPNPWGYDPATVYYLPRTFGWSNTFAGLPTALWLPQVQTGDGSFGVLSNQFGFNITWVSGQTVVVQACTNLASPVWAPVETNTFINNSFYFSDPQWTNYPGRFYRLLSP